MSFLETVPEEAAEGEVADMYARLRRAYGYLPNFVRGFSHRPALFGAWVRLISTVSGAMDPRRYELATVAAAVARRSSYCALAHGEKLTGLGSSPDEVVALLRDPSLADLDQVERAIVDYSAKAAADPVSISQGDIDRLRSVGLSDAEIFDVAAAVATRCFFTTLGDAIGNHPDAVYRETVPALVAGLDVGRPVDVG